MKIAKNTKIIFFLLICFLFINFMGPQVSAGSLIDSQEGFKAGEGIGKAFGESGEPTLSLNEIIANLILVFLGFMGILMTVIVLVAGFRWMTSQGNEEQITKAKSTLTAAAIGLVIILMSFAIASYVIECVAEITDDGYWACESL